MADDEDFFDEPQYDNIDDGPERRLFGHEAWMGSRFYIERKEDIRVNPNKYDIVTINNQLLKLELDPKTRFLKIIRAQIPMFIENYGEEFLSTREQSRVLEIADDLPLDKFNYLNPSAFLAGAVLYYLVEIQDKPLSIETIQSFSEFQENNFMKPPDVFRYYHYYMLQRSQSS